MSEYRLRMRELPPSDQPRERLASVGPAALSDAELLAILLRVGVPGINVLQLAQQTLVTYGGWPGLLGVEYAELSRQRGIGAAKAAKFKTAMEIWRCLILFCHGQPFRSR